MAFKIPRSIIRKISSTPRNIVIDPVIESKDFKAKNHPGVIKKGVYQIPDYVTSSISQILTDQPIKNVLKQGESLNTFLHSRHPPIEYEALKIKESRAQTHVLRKKRINFEELSEEEQKISKNTLKDEIKHQLNKTVYNWHPINYNEYISLCYLVGCAPSNYAVLQQIFHEMHQRLPNFKPSTLFDFGSGVGTVTWAANIYWKEFLKEYFNVDSSKEMHDLANVILNKGNKDAINKGVYYRQFLPSSHMIKYDLVVSAFSLFELPSQQSRLETILNLWNKTNGFLVLVENGTKQGFKIINEARDMILELNNDPQYKSYPNAYIFSPCPHDIECPKILLDPQNSLCNFEVRYLVPREIKNNPVVLKSTYSYVVIGKGKKPDNISQWSRLISKPLIRPRHVICRLCTNNGQLEELIFTQKKSSKLVYKCAKKSSWGDFLPFTKQEEENDDK